MEPLPLADRKCTDEILHPQTESFGCYSIYAAWNRIQVVYFYTASLSTLWVEDIVLAEAGPGLWDATCRIHTLDPAVQIYEPATSSSKIAQKQKRHSTSALHIWTFKSIITSRLH